jgi:peptidyl-dipeptidase Dcp
MKLIPFYIVVELLSLMKRKIMKKLILALIMTSSGLFVEAQNTNPLLNLWSGQYGGIPAFDKYKTEDFKPAIETAIKNKLAEIDKIANNPKPATFSKYHSCVRKQVKPFPNLCCFRNL